MFLICKIGTTHDKFFIEERVKQGNFFIEIKNKHYFLRKEKYTWAIKMPFKIKTAIVQAFSEEDPNKAIEQTEGLTDNPSILYIH